MRTKSNKNLGFLKDDTKSYVYVTEKGRGIGFFSWDYKKKQWRYDKNK